MDVFRIRGGNPLRGSVQVSGSKNSCLPILAATLLTDEPCVIKNVPDLSDIHSMIKLLQYLGAEVEFIDTHTVKIQAKSIHSQAPYELMRKMRASICVAGPLVARKREAKISLPGGCVFGPRPIDLHIKGLQNMGCEMTIDGGYMRFDASKLKGSELFLGGRYGSSVTGTANMIMAATLAPGTTHIDSAACEPEVVDLCHLLVSMGAQIKGIGSHSLEIEGIEKLHGTEYTVIEDRIEAGTLIIAGLMQEGSEIRVKGANVKHLRSLLHKLEEANADIQVIGPKEILVRGKALDQLKPVELTTLPYPGFPTDLQAQMCALMSVVPGLSIITERIYPNRFIYVSELQRMGANITLEGSSAIINGQKNLSGAPVMASDLRASVALCLAGFVANGETVVHRVYHLDRGYENFDDKVRALGTSIERCSQDALEAEIV
jgi:UDP-N-acetylglucosamine 1-carboxyvinyltransferase